MISPSENFQTSSIVLSSSVDMITETLFSCAACGEKGTKSLVYLTTLLLASVCFQRRKVKLHGSFQKFGKLRKGFGMDLSCHRYFRLMNKVGRIP